MTDDIYKPAISAYESERLRAVHSYDILDSPPDVDFDALARVAAYALDAPVALVGLMDSNRVWFKSRLGLDIPQLDRDVAFCAFAAMQSNEVLVIGDLQQDPRFKDNPLVSDPPHLRFYAGAPLVDPNGYVLGTVAVVDTQLRTFNEKQRTVLYDLSLLVMTALENRRHSLLLAKMALTDYLTGVANRAQFDRALKSEMAHAKRTGEPFSVFCLDLNGFKDINDRHGHPSGDEVLCEVARRLQKLVRTEDTLSRIGGDEFGMVIRESTESSVRALSKRIRQAMVVPVELSCGDSVEIGVSIGMASYNQKIESPYALLAHADSELYLAKRRNSKKR